MEKTNFTFVKAFRLFLPLMMLFSYSAINAQIACNDNVQISVAATPTDNSCTVEVTADMVSEADAGDWVQVYDGPFLVAEGAGAIIAGANAYFGETLTVRVYEGPAAEGNFCWGSINIEDKAAPVVECTDQAIDCTQAVPNPGVGVTAADNCSGTTIEIVDESTNDDDNCTTGTIVTRQYVAIDGSGNVSAPCTQTITITRVTDVDFPVDVEIECNDYAANNNLTAATASGAGVPSVAAGVYCNFAVSSSDELLELCGNDTSDNLFKIVRTWTVLDWCTNSLVTVGAGGEDNIQIIKVVDTTAPVITVGNQTVSASVPGQHPQPCKSQSILATADVSDNCSSWTVEVFTPVGPVTGNGAIPAPGLGIGDHLVTYVATDECGNTSEVTVTVTVTDDVTPTPVCDEITQVAIGADGVATVLAATFDDGSNDNCGIAGNTTFGPDVKFCCADVGSEVMVIFQVTDYYGNSNQCMVEVLVEDKLAPYKVQDVADGFNIACDDYFNNYAPALDLAEANGD